MWKAIYIVANQAQADKLCGSLTEEGFLRTDDEDAVCDR